MSFITVRYGNDQERVFNPNVMTSVFVYHIKRSCGFDQMPESIDLALDSGEVADLQGFLRQASNQREPAKKFLENRASYILVKCVSETADGDDSTSYIPLLAMPDSKIKFSVVKRKRATTAVRDTAQDEVKPAPNRTRRHTGANAA